MGNPELESRAVERRRWLMSLRQLKQSHLWCRPLNHLQRAVRSSNPELESRAVERRRWLMSLRQLKQSHLWCSVRARPCSFRGAENHSKTTAQEHAMHVLRVGMGLDSRDQAIIRMASVTSGAMILRDSAYCSERKSISERHSDIV